MNAVEKTPHLIGSARQPQMAFDKNRAFQRHVRDFGPSATDRLSVLILVAVPVTAGVSGDSLA
ncbi:hypothetical protein E4U61_004258 [Claviceps capensis]|nr:hypothetical protein E4U61_004258 [Claviceps capensis]